MHQSLCTQNMLCITQPPWLSTNPTELPTSQHSVTHPTTDTLHTSGTLIGNTCSDSSSDFQVVLLVRFLEEYSGAGVVSSCPHPTSPVVLRWEPTRSLRRCASVATCGKPVGWPHKTGLEGAAASPGGPLVPRWERTRMLPSAPQAVFGAARWSCDPGHWNWTLIQSSEFTSGSRFVTKHENRSLESSVKTWESEIMAWDASKPRPRQAQPQVLSAACPRVALLGSRPPTPAELAGESHPRPSSSSDSKDTCQGGSHGGSQQQRPCLDPKCPVAAGSTRVQRL